MRIFSTLMVFVFLAALPLGLTACTKSGEEAGTTGQTTAGPEGEVYGHGVSAADTVEVSELRAHPLDYVGRTVRVQGTAVAVCGHRGCWIDLATDVEGQTVRVKVNDGEIVFPPELAGDMVIAEGIWTPQQLDLETTRAIYQQQALERGESFDPSSVTEPMIWYQINGTGAVALEN